MNLYYGISKETWETMRTEQNNACSICKQSTKDLVTDHDHKTGKVRNLLCSPCNRLLGFVREDIELLTSVIDYLEKHNASNR